MLTREGSRPDCVYLIIEGLAARYRTLANGRRQILGYLLPGDMCDTQFIISNECDHDVGALCGGLIATIPLSTLIDTKARFPNIDRGLLMMSIVDGAVAREWLLNLGQRDAYQRLGHFFCELSLRFHAGNDGAQNHCVRLPLTQVDLADTMGLTMVHVNRILQRFRREGLLIWSHHHFHILDFQRLASLSGFDPGYLRLRKRPQEISKPNTTLHSVSSVGRPAPRLQVTILT